MNISKAILLNKQQWLVGILKWVSLDNGKLFYYSVYNAAIADLNTRACSQFNRYISKWAKNG